MDCSYGVNGGFTSTEASVCFLVFFPFYKKEGMQKGNLCTLMQIKQFVDWSGWAIWGGPWRYPVDERVCVDLRDGQGVYMFQEGIMSRMGFPNWLKSKEVKISDEKTSWMIVKEKALREGCHEREWAQMSVPSREKNNTKRNLARVTTKSKSKMQTVSNGCVSWWAMNWGVWRASQCWRPCQVSKIEA